LNQALKGEYKSRGLDVGCSIEALRGYLERLFLAGMSWENYGEWQVDHRVAISRFDLADPVQVLKAMHFTNLQPMWASENASKGAKLAVMAA
jgi:hypothetical protein